MRNFGAVTLFQLVVTCFLCFVVATTKESVKDSNQEPCNPNNLNLHNASTGEFLLLNDGSFRYHLPHCRLRRFRVAEASRCLRGTHIVFMGDSLSRYFYLDLAAFFAQGKWPQHFTELWPHGRSFLSEKEYNSWSWFYQDTNRALNRGNHAIEVCDCACNDSVGFFEFIRDMFENRHFRYIPNGNLDDDINDVRLSYIQWWGLMPMRGHQDISLKVPRNRSIIPFLRKWNDKLCPKAGESLWPLSRNCSDQRYDIHQIDFPDFSYKEICTEYPKPTVDPHTKEDRCQRFERRILAGMKTTHLLLNTGWHAGLEHVGESRFLEKLVDAGEKYFTPVPGYANVRLPKVTWRQSTAGAVFEDNDKIALNYTNIHGYDKLGFFSVGDITRLLREIDNMLRSKDENGLRRVVKPHPISWPSNKPINSSNIHLIWHDPAHFEPYVYNEINNLFLNAVCPLHLGATSGNSRKKET